MYNFHTGHQFMSTRYSQPCQALATLAYPPIDTLSDIPPYIPTPTRSRSVVDEPWTSTTAGSTKSAGTNSVDSFLPRKQALAEKTGSTMIKGDTSATSDDYAFWNNLAKLTFVIVLIVLIGIIVGLVLGLSIE